MPNKSLTEPVVYDRLGNCPSLIIENLVDAMVAEGMDREEAREMITPQVAKIVQLTRENIQLKIQLKIDKLTGLNNKAAFNEAIDDEFSRNKRYNRPFALLSFDIDHFKAVNDSLDHSVGDLALQVLSELAKETMRTQDVCARVGGEEFSMILPETNEENAELAARRFRESVDNEFIDRLLQKYIESDYYQGEIDPKLEIIKNLKRVQKSGTISIGVRAFDESDQSPADMIRDADAACTMAKNMGRNQVVVFQAGQEIVIEDGDEQEVAQIHRMLSHVGDDKKAEIYQALLAKVRPTGNLTPDQKTISEEIQTPENSEQRLERLLRERKQLNAEIALLTRAEEESEAS